MKDQLSLGDRREVIDQNVVVTVKREHHGNIETHENPSERGRAKWLRFGDFLVACQPQSWRVGEISVTDIASIFIISSL